MDRSEVLRPRNPDESRKAAPFDRGRVAVTDAVRLALLLAPRVQALQAEHLEPGRQARGQRQGRHRDRLGQHQVHDLRQDRRVHRMPVPDCS